MTGRLLRIGCAPASGWTARLCPLVLLICITACGPDEADVEPGVVAFETPSALTVDCAQTPTDMKAQLWVSGNRSPCELKVDLEAGETTGECEVAPGQKRDLTLDWYVERTFEGEDVQTTLAQVRDTLDLREPDGDEVEWNPDDDDVELSACVRITPGTPDGVGRVAFDGADRPVCDLDESCLTDDAPGCTNLGEICAGQDPFAP